MEKFTSAAPVKGRWPLISLNHFLVKYRVLLHMKKGDCTGRNVMLIKHSILWKISCKSGIIYSSLRFLYSYRKTCHISSYNSLIIVFHYLDEIFTNKYSSLNKIFLQWELWFHQSSRFAFTILITDADKKSISDINKNSISKIIIYMECYYV